MGLETVDIINDLVAGMPIKFVVKQVTDNTTSYTVATCGTLYLSKGLVIDLGGIKYTVESVVDNESVTLKGPTAPVVGSYLLAPMFFKHGSVLETKKELDLIKDTTKKTPMVYLKRTFSETFNAKTDAVERVANINLFFLTHANFEQWQTADHDKHAIKPMRNMVYSFLEYLERHPYIGLIDSYTLVDRIKFGVITDIGVDKAYWDDKLSGVELAISLPINRNFKCNC